MTVKRYCCSSVAFQLPAIAIRWTVRGLPYGFRGWNLIDETILASFFDWRVIGEGKRRDRQSLVREGVS